MIERGRQKGRIKASDLYSAAMDGGLASSVGGGPVRCYSHQKTGFAASTVADDDELSANLGHGLRTSESEYGQAARYDERKKRADEVGE